MAGSSRKVNVEVALSGEAKYKQAISELNAANKTMGAELKRLAAEYQGNSDSLDFLTKKGEGLQTMLDHQKEKVAQLQEAVKWAAQEYGEASTKTQSYAAQLANAETSVINLERAIQDNNKAMDQQIYSTDAYDRQIAVLNSELRELDSEMAAGADKTEILRQKNETLTAVLEEQAEKYKTLVSALGQAEESGNATEEEIAQLKIQVNEAATAYNNTSAAIQQNSQALQDHLAKLGMEEKGLTGIGDALSGISSKFGIQLPDAAKSALNGMGSFSTGTVAALGAAAAGVTALYEGIKALHQMTVEYAAYADEIITKSASTGLSTEFLQAYEYAQNLVDVDLDTFTASMQRLTDKMADARDGNEKLAATFEQLGVSVIDTSDGSLRPAEEVIMEVIDALHNMGNETERNAVASDLFGKSYQSLNPLIVSGTETLQEYMEAAKDNYVLTEDQIAALGALDDQIQMNNNEWEALKRQIAAQFAPAAKEALENFAKLVTAAGNALIDSGIITGVGEIFTFLSNMLQPLTDLLDTADTAPGRLSPVYEVLHGIAGVLAWIQDAANVCIGLIQTLTVVGAPSGLRRIGNALGYGASSGNYSNLQKWQQSGDRFYAAANGNYYNSQTGRWEGNYGRNAGGTDNWRGGLTWVGEAGPELVDLPRGSKVLNAQDSKKMGTVYIGSVVIDAKNVKEFNDIVRMAQTAAVETMMG
ncbi:MAG TPA: hypothetical protein DEV97_07710 [Lachnospiraceae bacterium]|nr:hypothetical protein [Lachnospiraceae bacterium]